MKERPILFSGPMVRAILEGRKTVTRRVVKANPDKDMGKRCVLQPHELAGEVNAGNFRNCRYGQPGDRLWVRESFADLRGTGIEHRPDPTGPLQRYAFAADSPPGSCSDEARKDFGVKWKPSIHMPRAACRILLEITAVRVERLKDLSYEQALAEGINHADDGLFHVEDSRHLGADPRESFAGLWESINGDGSWDANPWVWVVEFKRVGGGNV